MVGTNLKTKSTLPLSINKIFHLTLYNYFQYYVFNTSKMTFFYHNFSKLFPDPGLLSSFHVGLQYTSCPHPPWETRSSLYVAGFTWVLSPGPPDLEELEGLRRQCWCTRSSAPEACPTLWTPQLLSSWRCSQSSPG